MKVGDGMGIGHAGIFCMVYLSTVLLSSVVANNAAAALIFPVAMDVAEQGCESYQAYVQDAKRKPAMGEVSRAIFCPLIPFDPSNIIQVG